MEEARDPPNGVVEVSLPTNPRAFFASLYTTILTLGTGYYKYETGPFVIVSLTYLLTMMRVLVFCSVFALLYFLEVDG